MVPSHLLPMVDIAKLLARRNNNMKVTLATTPLNAVRVQDTIDSEIQSGSTGLQIQLFQFPNAESGVPEGCESFDSLPSTDLIPNFYKALSLLHEPLEKLFENLIVTSPSPPTCVIFDKNVPSASDVAKKFNIPSIIFDGTSCFNLMCTHCLLTSRVYENVSDSETFMVPGLPGNISFKKQQLHSSFSSSSTNIGIMAGFREKVKESEENAYGIIVNSFDELEGEYVKEYKRVTGKKVWCIGPVSLSNKDALDNAKRGGKPDSKVEEGEEEEYVKWLDLWPERSVIYVCLGSLTRVAPRQLMELGLGLEASKRPFIWVLRDSHNREVMEKIMKGDGLEERIKGRGMITRNWVPQVLILSHKAIGAFLTHCGWNSTLEGISNGVPLITFPMFSEQFYNEKIIVEVLGIGVNVGAEKLMPIWGEDKDGVVHVKKEQVRKAIEKVMSEGDEESERVRERAKEYGEKANKAMEKDGSSSINLSLLIEDIACVMGLKMN